MTPHRVIKYESIMASLRRSMSSATKTSLRPKLTRSIVLVGLMGAGKSCVGRRLAQRLDAPFIDADQEIEAASGYTIADFFEQFGEEAFRDGERKVMRRLLDGPPSVLATGGGAYVNEETRALIESQALSLWLKADLDILIKRTIGRKHRPLLNQGDPKATLRRLMDDRYPVYAQAALTIPTGDEPLERSVERAMSLLAPYLSAPEPCEPVD